MADSRREKIRDITREEIKNTARQLMAEKGAAGLSIRAIAREMGMTASALYHYFSNLNGLITALIEDAFTQLAVTIEAASKNPDLTKSTEQLTAVANAYRQWALNNPTDFQLIYGNPIPGYSQPTGITYPPARRSFIVTARIFTSAIKNEEIDLPTNYRDLPPSLEQSLLDLKQVDGHDLPLPALYLAATAWVKIHGHVMLELFDLIQPVIPDVDDFYQYELKNFIKNAGLKQP